MSNAEKKPQKATAKDRLLDAALSVIRAQGYSATTVDNLCEAAGVTKGAFFHHFATKEDLAVEAAKYWSVATGEFFKNAAYHKHADPLDRFVGYIQFRKEILRGEIREFTCLVGTMVQEAYDSHPEIREACHDSIFGHAHLLEPDIAAAQKLYCPKPTWTAKSLALHTQAVLQGAFILAKASADSHVAAESIDHLIRYVQLLFNKDIPSGKRMQPKQERQKNGE